MAVVGTGQVNFVRPPLLSRWMANSTLSTTLVYEWRVSYPSLSNRGCPQFSLIDSRSNDVNDCVALTPCYFLIEFFLLSSGNSVEFWIPNLVTMYQLTSASRIFRPILRTLEGGRLNFQRAPKCFRFHMTDLQLYGAPVSNGRCASPSQRPL